MLSTCPARRRAAGIDSRRAARPRHARGGAGLAVLGHPVRPRRPAARRPGRRQHARPVGDLLQPRWPRPRRGPGLPAVGAGVQAADGDDEARRRRPVPERLRHRVGDLSRLRRVRLSRELARGEDAPRILAPHPAGVESADRPAVHRDRAARRRPVRARDPVRPADERAVGGPDAQPAHRRPLGPRRDALRRLPRPAHTRSSRTSSSPTPTARASRRSSSTTSTTTTGGSSGRSASRGRATRTGSGRRSRRRPPVSSAAATWATRGRRPEST